MDKKYYIRSKGNSEELPVTLLIKNIIRISKRTWSICKENFITAIFLCNTNGFRVNQEAESVKKRVLKMNAHEFEKFCASVFRAAGYKVKISGEVNDYSRDIIIEKNGIKTFVNCKRWLKDTGYTVGKEKAEKLVKSAYASNVRRGIIINTGDYNKNTYEYRFKVSNVGNFKLELWDLDELMKLYKLTQFKILSDRRLKSYQSS